MESIVNSMKTIASPIIGHELVELYLNPLYVFPIFGVMLLMLLVYACGFKSTESIPPTLHLLVDESEKKGHLNKKKKEKKSDHKTVANGGVAKQEQKPKETKAKSPKPAKAQAEKVDKKSPKVAAAPSPTVPKSGKTKSQKGEGASDAGAVDQDRNDGGWVKVLSAKDKRILKEKQEKSKAKSAAKAAHVATLSPKKTNNKGKENQESSPDPNQKKAQKETESPKGKKSPKESGKKTETSGEASPAIEITANSETAVEDPEPYVVKAERISKKNSKKLDDVKKRRNSEKEIEKNVIVEEPVESVPVEETKGPKDKLTDDVLADYETKSDSTAPKKKKKKKNNANKASPDSTAQLSESQSNEKAANVETKEISVEIKKPEAANKEDDFKVQSKKRRSRKE